MNSIQLNEKNAEFWAVQNELLQARITDPVLFELATKDMNSEYFREVSLKSRKSLEQALEDAEAVRCASRREFSIKGGRARKADALQAHIGEIVEETPDISWKELWHKLEKEEGVGVITKIDRVSKGLGLIYFKTKGIEESAPVKGLKDRLTRARKTIRAKRLARRSTTIPETGPQDSHSEKS